MEKDDRCLTQHKDCDPHRLSRDGLDEDCVDNEIESGSGDKRANRLTFVLPSSIAIINLSQTVSKNVRSSEAAIGARSL
jgi:hypothetical protein